MGERRVLGGGFNWSNRIWWKVSFSSNSWAHYRWSSQLKSAITVRCVVSGSGCLSALLIFALFVLFSLLLYFDTIYYDVVSGVVVILDDITPLLLLPIVLAAKLCGCTFLGNSLSLLIDRSHTVAAAAVVVTLLRCPVISKERAAVKNNAAFTVMTSKRSLSVVVCLLSFFSVSWSYVPLVCLWFTAFSTVCLFIWVCCPLHSPVLLYSAVLRWQMFGTGSQPPLSHINWCKSVKSIVCCWSNSITSHSMLLLPNGTN